MADKIYIERGALIENIKRVYCTDCNSYDGVRCRACGTGDALDMIDDAPTADVAPRAEVDKAYWEGVEYGHKDGAALVAREIFEEMDEIMLPLLHEVSQVYIYVKLKRKYTDAEAEPPEGD